MQLTREMRLWLGTMQRWPEQDVRALLYGVVVEGLRARRYSLPDTCWSALMLGDMLGLPSEDVELVLFGALEEVYGDSLGG